MTYPKALFLLYIPPLPLRLMVRLKWISPKDTLLHS